MDFGTGVIPEQLQGAYLSQPEFPLPDKGPDILDLINTSGGGGGYAYQPPAELDAVEKGLQAFESKAPSGTALAAPTFFDWDRSQVERYTSNTRDFAQLGYNPHLGPENEFAYARLQTWGDVWKNGLAGMFSLAGNTYVEGWKGWGNLADAISSWDSSKLVGTPEDLLEQDRSTKEIMNKYAIYNLPEYEEGVFNRKFFGDMLQQSGFAVGTIGQFLTEELLTWGMSTGFSLAKLGIKAPTWAGRIVTKADVAKDMVSLGNSVWKSRTIPEFLVTGARKVIPFADTGYTMAKYGKAGAGALQLASIGVGGVRRFLSEANMAMTEARMEAAGTYGELYNKMYDEELFRTGEAPAPDVLARIEQTAKDAAFDNFQVNSGILMLANRLQFDNLFSKFSFGRKVLGEGTSEFAEDVLKITGKTAVKEGVAKPLTKVYQKGALGTLGLFPEIAKDFGKRKAAWEATKSLGKNIFKWEASEGIQELFQEGSNKALSDYYYDLYHGAKGSELTDYISKAAEEQYSIQGAKTFLMGALTGRLLSPINFTVGKIKEFAGTSKDQRLDRNKKIAESLEALNGFYQNPNLYLPEHIANVKVQDKAAKNMQEAIANRDAYVFHNNKDSAFAKMISAAIKTDMIDGVIDTIREYGEAFDDNEFKEAFGFDKTEENVASTKDFFNKVADNIVDFHKTWRELKNRFSDLVIPDLYKEGTPERKTALRAKRALDEAIEVLATVDYKARQSTLRARDLQTKMAALPVLGSTVATAFRNIGVIQNTEKEIELLKTEIENLEDQEKKDKATKDLLKAKKDQLKSLEAWNENYAQLNNMTRGNKRKSKKARAALKNYLNAKNQESSIDIVIKENELEEIYGNLLDYIELNKDNKEYIDAYNVLANPIKFVQVHQKLLDAMDSVEQKKLLEHVQEILKEQEGKSQLPPEEEKEKLKPSTERPDFETYIKDSYEGQFESGNTTLSYEDWLKSNFALLFVKMYNGRWGTNFTIDSIGGTKSDFKTSLEDLKKDIQKKEFLSQDFINSVFENLSEILNLPLKNIEEQYEAFIKSIPEDKLKEELIKVGYDKSKNQDEATSSYNKYVLPAFIDDLQGKGEQKSKPEEVILNQDDFEIIPQKAKQRKLSKPKLAAGEKLIDDGISGLFIVQSPSGLFYIVDSDGKNIFNEEEVSNATLDKNEAFSIRNEFLKMRDARDKKESSFFQFAGLSLKNGLVLIRKDDGRRFMVVSKGEPYTPRDKDGNVKTDNDGNPMPQTVALLRLQGGTITRNVDYLTEEQMRDNFRPSLKSEKLTTGKIVPKNLSRLYRTTELNRIFPHQKTVDGQRENKQEAQKRLDDILTNTTSDDLSKNISIRIKKNPAGRGVGKPVNTGEGKIDNPFLYRYGQQYEIQILLNNQPIGYLTNYTDLAFVDEEGINIAFDNLTLDQFRMIFDPQGKSIEKSFEEFKTAYQNSKDILFNLKKYLKGAEEVVVPASELQKVVKFTTTGGELNYVAENEVGTKLEDLQHNTINGFYYILDRSRRYGNGYSFEVTSAAVTNAEGKDREQIEAEISAARNRGVDPLEQLGRYTAVVKLPNGNIRFVELKTDVVSDDFLNDLISSINDRTKLTKENNIQEDRNEKNEKIFRRKSFDYNKELNTVIANELFISVPISQKGMYINIGVTDVGDLVLEFHKKEGKKDIREKIYLYGSKKEEPVFIESIDDLIKKINEKINSHDAIATADEFKIGFNIKRENFKTAIPDIIDEKDLNKLRTDLKPSVVKNVPLVGVSLSDAQAPKITPDNAVQQKPQTNTQGEVKIDEEAVKRQQEAIAAAKAAQEALQQQTPSEEQLGEIDILKKKVEDLKKEKEQYYADRRVQLKTENPERRNALIMDEASAEASAKFDTKIQQAQEEYNKARNSAKRNRALKVTSKKPFDQRSIVNINKFKKYISQILGDVVSVEEANNLSNSLKDGNVTVGQFLTYLEKVKDGAPKVKGKIQVGENSPFKYHEAFHAVFRLMLTDKQIDRLLGLAKIEVKKQLAKEGKTLASELKSMRELHTLYADMTEQELEERYYEEYLADKFDAWKLNAKTEVVPGAKNFFQWLWNFITSLFRNRTKNEIETLFTEIDRGRYKNSKVKENRFTKPDALSISEPVLKAIKVGEQSVEDEDGFYVTIPKYLSQQEGDKLASTVASIFHKKVLSIEGNYNKSQILEQIFNDFLELYDPQREFYLDEIDNLLEIDEAQAESYRRKLKERFEVFINKENRKTLAQAVDVHLNIMGYQQTLEDEEYTSMEDEFGSRYSTDNWREAHSIGGFGSLSSALRKYIASTVYEVDGDEFGNKEFLNGEPLIEAVNANLVYNGILKAVANITDQNKFVARLYELSNTNTETAKFLKKFIYDVGLIYDETNKTFIVTNTKQGTLFQMVIKGFQQYTVDYIFINKDIRASEKKSVLMLANRMGAVKTQFSQWQNAFSSVYFNELLKLKSKEERKTFAEKRTAFLQDLITNLSPSKPITDEKLDGLAQDMSDALKTNLGIALSPLYIKFSIASVKETKSDEQQRLVDAYSEVEPMSIEDIREIMKSLRALEDPFAKNIDVDKEKEINVSEEGEDTEDVDALGEGGNIGRLSNLAKGNAIFDETVSTTSYKNAEGQLVYSHQIPTFHLVKVNSLNDAEEINKIKQDAYLTDNILLNSEEFQTMLQEGNFRIDRIEGMKSSILSEDEEGNLREDKTIQSNQNTGLTYGSFSDREFIISLLELYKYNKEKKVGNKSFLTSQHLVRVIEASNTGDTVSLPVMERITTDTSGNTEITKDTIELLYKEVMREADRIISVKNEIKTKNFKEGEIEGYHYAIDENERRTNERPRGLKFYKMRLMLGQELATEIEDGLINDPSFKIENYKNKIDDQIQEYWKNQFDTFVNKLDELGVITISSDENTGEERLFNNLIDDFISKGFTVKQDGKQVIDEKKNKQLNLIPGNLRHNLSQIMLNDFINTLSFNQLLYGDEAKAFKNSIDQVKRAKGANGSGASLESIVTNPSLGITKEFTKSHILTFTNPKYQAKFAGGQKDKADAQSYMTTQTARYVMYGLGKLTPRLAKIFDKLDVGEPLTKDEVFGPNGLKQAEEMLNSLKLVYFDGPQYIKTSTVILTKELTSQKIDGKWVSQIGTEELHELRERMEKFEKDSESFTFAAPSSASKGRKTNVFDHTLGFGAAKDDNFVEQETKYWRLQLENPSNKLIITDPTQAKQLIISEQDDNLKVNFMGVNTTMGDLKKIYLDKTAQRTKNNYDRARNSIFDIDEAYKELGKSIDLGKVTPKLAKFQERAVDTLRSSGSDSQTIEFFSLDDNGKPKYDLNNSMVIEKYTQLFLAYFSKGVISEKIPGHSVALMSNYGKKVVKRFTGRYMEDGVTPIGEVVPAEIVKKDYNKYKDAKRWNNDLDRQFEGLKEGDFYVDDLRHNVPEFDSRGKIIGRYTEFILPAHFAEDLNLDLTKPLPDWIAKAFGVRIPSQDKHSFVSLKLVDFLPAYYGSTGIFAHELIEISGADFDIDKLYMQIAETYVKNGLRVPYGTETSKEGRFNEFVSWNFKNNKEFKKAVKQLLDVNPSYQKTVKDIKELVELKKSLNDLLEKVPESEKSIRESLRTALMVSRMIDSYFADRLDVTYVEYLEDYNSLEEVAFNRDLNEMLSKLDERELVQIEREYALDVVPVILKSIPRVKELNSKLIDIKNKTVGEVLKQLELPSNVLDYAKATKKVELNNGVLNNEILAAKLLLLNNDKMTKEGIAFEVASVDPLKDLVKELKEMFKDVPEMMEILDEPEVDTDSLFGKYKSYKSNKEGSRNIGPAVNAMLVYGILNSFGIKLRDNYTNKKGEKVNLFKFNLNGIEFGTYAENRSFNFETGKYDSKDRIANMISTLVSAMTDNAKERLAARLGLNIEAIGYVANMVSQGVPLKSATTFMLQPIVRKYFEQSKIASFNIKTGVEENIKKSSILKTLYAELMREIGEDYEPVSLTDDILIDNIKDNGSNKLYEIAVLENFMGIVDQSRQYSSVAKILKLTKGLGTSFDEYDSIDDVIDNLGLRIKDDNAFEKFVGDSGAPVFDLRQALMGYDENKPHHSFIKNNIQIADQINQLSVSMFLMRTPVFKRITEIVKANFKVRGIHKAKFNEELNKDLLSYLSIKAYMKYLIESGKQTRLETLDNALIYDVAAEQKGENFLDIIDNIRLIRDKMPENFLAVRFLNAIPTSIVDAKGEKAFNPYNKDGINKLEVNTWAKLNEYQIEKLRDSFIEIYQSDIDFNGRNGREMAHVLMNYLLVKDGGQFRSGSFLRFLPNFMFLDLLNSTKKANEVMKLSKAADDAYSLEEEYKKIFGAGPLELYNDFMSNYVTHVANGYYVGRKFIYNKGEFEPTGDPAADEFEPQSFIMDKDEKEIKINIFRGIREREKKKDMTEQEWLEEQSKIEWIDDFEYLQSLEAQEGEEVAEGIRVVELKPQKKGYNETEHLKFRKNMQLLEQKGFTKNRKGETEFPYIFKVKGEGPFASDKYYVLKKVTKANPEKGKPNIILDSKNVIQKGELVASGIGAIYELVERVGSRKSFKAGGALFGEIPETATLPRYRRPINNSDNYGPYYKKFDDPIKEYNYLSRIGVPVEEEKQAPKAPEKQAPVTITIDTGNRSPKQILFQDYGINMEMINGKIQFSGDVYDMFSEQDKAAIGTSPGRLLTKLGYTPSSEAPRVYQQTKTESEVKEVEEDVSKQKSAVQLSPEQMKEIIRKAQRGEKVEIPEQPPIAKEEEKITEAPTQEVSEDNPLKDECAKPKAASPEEIMKAIRTGKMPPNF